MKRVWIIPAVSIGPVAFVLLSGSLLDPHYQAGSSLRVQATPEAIWEVLIAVENYPRWRPDIADVEVKSRKPNLSWIEYDALGRATTYAVDAAVPPGKWRNRMVEGSQPMRGSRTFLIVATEDGGTEIAVKEDGEIRNPLERFRYRFQTGYATALNAYLAELRVRLGE